MMDAIEERLSAMREAMGGSPEARGKRFAASRFGGDDFGKGYGAGGPFGGRGGGGGRGGPGMGRRKRLFDQAELQSLLLALIAGQPRHGYDLIREIERLSGGAYAPSPGVVYPALSYMEEAGLIAPQADQAARKVFEATAQGLEQVARDSVMADGLIARLTGLAAERDRFDPAPVRRAVHALKTAVFDRLAAAGANENGNRELVLKMADVIDEATRKIERIEG